MTTNYNASRYTRLFAQKQTAFTSFNNTSGTWTNTGAQLQRVDQGSISITRNAPYNRFPVLTGTRSEVAGIRGRKAASWEVRGMPLIPSGTAGTAPDCDVILQNIFGAPSTGSGDNVYAFTDTGYLPLSLFEFRHGSTTLTHRAVWGAVVTRVVWNFNSNFLTMDLTGAAGYAIDSAGFSAFDTQAKAGLSTYPIEPTSPTVNGQPIAGFGSGYTATIDSQGVQLSVRVMSITLETGLTLVSDVYGSPYPIAIVGDTRRASMAFTLLDDDSSALNDLKTKADTDNVTVSATVVAGTTAGSIATWVLNNVQLNAFDLKDNGAMVDFEIPTSYAHASSIGATDDMTLTFS